MAHIHNGYHLISSPFVQINPCWMKCIWKCLFSWKFPGNLRGRGGRSRYNYCQSLCFVVIMPDYDGEWSYQYFDVWYVDSSWSSPKIFLKYHTGCKFLKNVKKWNLAKILCQVHRTKKSNGYFDARTEFELVTHFWEYLP